MAENLIYSIYLWYNTQQKQRVIMIRRYKTFCFSSEAHIMLLVCDAFNLVETGTMSVCCEKWIAVCPYGPRNMVFF